MREAFVVKPMQANVVPMPTACGQINEINLGKLLATIQSPAKALKSRNPTVPGEP